MRTTFLSTAVLGLLLHVGSTGCDIAQASPSEAATQQAEDLVQTNESASNAAGSNAASQPAAAPAMKPTPASTPGSETTATTAAALSCPPTMVLVRGGELSTLERGKDVKVADFCIDVREVTVADYRACVLEGHCQRQCASPADCPPIPTHTAWKNPDVDNEVSRLCNGQRNDREGHPVNCVSFEEASGYCAALGQRLPSGDEWEWAAHGGSEHAVSPWGTAVATNQVCWGKPKKRAGTCAEGSFESDKTPQGALDMGGNLSEWTSAPARNKATRGVHWVYGASWYAIDDGYARAALGGVQMPADRAETVGFRCAGPAK